MQGLDLIGGDIQEQVLVVHLHQHQLVANAQGQGFPDLDALTQPREIAPQASATHPPKDGPKGQQHNKNT